MNPGCYSDNHQYPWGLFLYHDASDNIIRRNNFAGFTVIQQGPFGPSSISVGAYCHDNTFRDNIIGPMIAAEEGRGAGIYCAGDNNDFIRNDYTQSGLQGLSVSGRPCVWLAVYYDVMMGDYVDDAENNLVVELDGLPPGTTAAEQVLDDPRECTGTTTNIVVGH